jgi:hypothetical protein
MLNKLLKVYHFLGLNKDRHRQPVFLFTFTFDESYCLTCGLQSLHEML